MIAEKQEEELAAEAEKVKSEEKNETTQDETVEKTSEDVKNEEDSLKESQSLPNGEVVQDEDEGVDLRGDIYCISCFSQVVSLMYDKLQLIITKYKA